MKTLFKTLLVTLLLIVLAFVAIWALLGRTEISAMEYGTLRWMKEDCPELSVAVDAAMQDGWVSNTEYLWISLDHQKKTFERDKQKSLK